MWLKRISEPAAASLQEGLEETLMVEKRLRKVKGSSSLNSLLQALEKVDLMEKRG